jgi:hypothetical protein
VSDLDSSELIRVQRSVHHLARELFVFLSQQDGRPLSAGLIAKVREYGVRCYLEGLSEAHRDPWLDENTHPTVPAPRRDDP